LLTFYANPDLFGVTDNNPFGLKVYAFMWLCGLSFEHRHILDTQQAPRGQSPYLVDGDESIGDSVVHGYTARRDWRLTMRGCRVAGDRGGVDGNALAFYVEVRERAGTG